MRYLKFTIKNFKGIKSATVDLGKHDNARIYTLVGLNEGGKTTVLEAIHAFLPDIDSGTVVGTNSSTYKVLESAVPRSRIADFTGRVSVQAILSVDENDRNELEKLLKNQGIFVNPESIKDKHHLSLERYVEFKNGDAKGSYYILNFPIKIKKKNQRTYKNATNNELNIIKNAVIELMPSIAYFPTFVFDFPDKIYLSERTTNSKNTFYKKLFQDILDYSGRGHKCDEHIVQRIRKPEFKNSWAKFLSKFRGGNESDQIDQVVDHAAATVTSLVYKKWNDIFGEKVGNKEISITWDVEEGLKKTSASAVETDAVEHDIFVTFRVKDGADRFPIGTRSLGFRWFFSFLLFTQFRAGRSNKKPVLFLLDEPASNLHASAQQKLIESFSEIAKKPHQLIYSTHSHYMIEPKWLEQAYIVQNEPATSAKSVIDEAVFDDSTVDIKVIPYRQFVATQGSSLSFFQPIVDRLRIVPSKFDLNKPCILIEGKSDYYFLEYFKQTLKFKGLDLCPALGSGTMGSLIALLKGWGQEIRIVLDSDKSGKKEAARYKENFVLSDHEVSFLEQFFSGAKEIEDIISNDDLSQLATQFSNERLTKKDLSRIFQEALAGNITLDLTTETLNSVKQGLVGLKEFLERKN